MLQECRLVKMKKWRERSYGVFYTNPLVVFVDIAGEM